MDDAAEAAPIAAPVDRLLTVVACGRALVRQNPPGIGRSGHVCEPYVVLSELRCD